VSTSGRVALDLPRVEAAPRPRARPWTVDVLLRLVRLPSALFGLAVLAVLALAALTAPIVSPYDPVEQNFNDLLVGPRPDHPFGTDQFGRDIFSRVIWGGRVTLQVGLIAVAISAALGLPLGLAAGYHGSWVDMLITRFMDLVLAFPSMLLALGVIAILGSSLTTLMIAVGIAGVPQFTRVVRSAVLATRSQPFVEAARVAGCPDGQIMWRHILPNVLAPAVVLATTGVAAAIITGAALSFLGLGVRPPSPEWGAMLSTGREFLRHAPWMSIFPGLAIMLAVLAINLVGDGLRDALDPRLRID
jgi:peptide/nickel transport system permease protein